MRKNIKEITRVNEILEEGLYVSRVTISGTKDKYLPEKYYVGISDLILMIKYFSGLGYKPKRVREEIINLWVNYDEFVDYKVLDKYIRKVRATKDYALHEVEPIKVSRECIDYFANLINFDYDTRTINGRTFTGTTALTRPITKSVVKLMFTLYIWSQIQKQFGVENYKSVYIKNCNRRMFKTANTKPRFNWRDIGAISDSGLGDIQWSLDSKHVWYIDYTPEFEEGDLEVDIDNIGIWFEGQVGWKNEREKETYYYCSVCGKKMKTSRKNQVCEKCKKKINREKSKERMRKMRAKNKIKGED